MITSVGQSAQRSLAVTAESAELFAQLSGDRNPIHFDAEWSGRTRFARLMAQGGIATGLLHALVAMDLPGPGTAFMEQRWQFPAPVYIGDTITAHGEITGSTRKKPIAKMDFRVVNQDGEPVLTGEATVYQAQPQA